MFLPSPPLFSPGREGDRQIGAAEPGGRGKGRLSKADLKAGALPPNRGCGSRGEATSRVPPSRHPLPAPSGQPPAPSRLWGDRFILLLLFHFIFSCNRRFYFIALHCILLCAANLIWRQALLALQPAERWRLQKPSPTRGRGQKLIFSRV